MLAEPASSERHLLRSLMGTDRTTRPEASCQSPVQTKQKDPASTEHPLHVASFWAIAASPSREAPDKSCRDEGQFIAVCRSFFVFPVLLWICAVRITHTGFIPGAVLQNTQILRGKHGLLVSACKNGFSVEAKGYNGALPHHYFCTQRSYFSQLALLM